MHSWAETTSKKARKRKNWHLWAEKRILGQFWVTNKKRTICSQYFREFYYSFSFHFFHLIICIFRLIHKSQVEGSKERTLIWIFPLKSSFNFYFSEWASLVSAITFGQVSESSSSMGKVSEVSISWYHHL